MKINTHYRSEGKRTSNKALTPVTPVNSRIRIATHSTYYLSIGVRNRCLGRPSIVKCNNSFQKTPKTHLYWSLSFNTTGCEYHNTLTT